MKLLYNFKQHLSVAGIIVISSFILFFSSKLNAQKLKCTIYDNEDGLSSNLIKSVVQDSIGYIWIASDAGLSRFDGKNFTSFSSQFPSLFVKDVKTDKSNRLIVITDLGAGYFLKRNNKYEFINIASGSSLDSDSTLLYPKSIYVDRNGNLWISEQYSISKVTNNGLKKYRFSQRDYSDSYSRAFHFAEDNTGNLYAFSWRGYIYKYDYKNDIFVDLEFTPPFSHFNINEIQVVYDNSIWCATSNGLIKIEIDDQQRVSYKVINDLKGISSFRFNREGNIYLGTWFNGCYFLNIKTSELRHIDELPFRSVSNMFIDNENSLWICSDDGLAIMKETYFAQADYQGEANTAYIINVISDNGSIYFSDQEIIYKVINNGSGYTYQKILDSDNHRIYNFDVLKEKMWVSYRTGELEYYPSPGKKNDHTDLIKGRINAVTMIEDDVVWGFDEKSKEFVRIVKEKDVKYYSAGKYKPEYIRVIRASDKDEIFFGGNGTHSFFFKYNPQKNNIENLSDLFSKEPDYIITIYDMYSKSDGTLLIASSLGVFSYKNGALNQLKIDGYNYITKAIHSDSRGRLWLGSERGLVLLDDQEVTSYYKQDGLPNSSISERAIAFDKNQRLWVGTASGLAYWQNINAVIQNTPKPFISSILISGKEKQISEITELTGNIDFEANFASLSFPNRIEYQTRLLGFENDWSEKNSYNTFRVTNLPPNDYTFQIRARQSGYFWSPVAEVRFTVKPPWFRTWWMLIIYIFILILLLIFFTYFINNKRIQKYNQRQIELERLVNEKTKDLQEEKETTLKLLKQTERAKKEIERVNDELRDANQFKSDLLSIAAHDLKNPLSSIIGFSKMIKDENHNPQITQMVSIIYDSSLRMLNLIADILESVSIESSKLNLNIELLNLSELCRKVIDNNTPRAKMKNQDILCNIENDIYIDADEKWMREALDNILNNAIKYSPKGKVICVDLHNGEDCVRFSVKDDGPGLTEDDKKNLFKKFTRLSAQPTGGESSTGLGLSIVKEIVELHKGRIWAESEFGKGSTFVIQLKSNLQNTNR